MSEEQSGRRGVYAGTFDPITVGHLDIIERGLTVVDRLYVAVAAGTAKSAMFDVAKRTELVRSAISELSQEKQQRIEVASFDGLLVDYVRAVGARLVIRGLRAVSDYEYEAQMAHINRHLDGEIETVFLVTSKDCLFISSSIVKDIARNGGDISRLVTPTVAECLQANF